MSGSMPPGWRKPGRTEEWRDLDDFALSIITGRFELAAHGLDCLAMNRALLDQHIDYVKKRKIETDRKYRKSSGLGVL